MKYCKFCKNALTVGENWLLCNAKVRKYVCRDCEKIKREELKKYKEEHPNPIILNVDICRVCGEVLIVGDNWLESRARGNRCICKPCEYSRNKDWQDNNVELITSSKREYYIINRGYINNMNRVYRSKPENKLKRSERERKRRLEDPWFNICSVLRSGLNKWIRNGRKTASAVKDMGCTKEEFEAHFESLFQPGMTWENYGKVWHVDHIEPLCSFDPEDREQLLVAINYKNLRPLFKEDNLKKSAEDKKKSIRKKKKICRFFDKLPFGQADVERKTGSRKNRKLVNRYDGSEDKIL